MDKIKPSRVLTFAGATLAFSIGSGFSTGQELLQYFASYGYQMILVALVFTAIFIYSNYCFITAGAEGNLTKGSQVFRYFCGNVIGTVYDYFAVIFCYLSFVVMVGGAAATLQQQYGVPLVVGGSALAACACLTVIFGLDSLVNVISKIGPIIVILSLFIGITAFIMGADQVNAGIELMRSGQVKVMQASNHWFFAGCSYGGFCLLWFAGFMAELGSKNKTPIQKKELVFGMSTSCILNISACVIVGFALIANIAAVASEQIPNLVLAMNIFPGFAYFFAIIIVAAVYTTSVPLLWTASSRFTEEKSKGFKILTIILAALGLFIALNIPYNRLLNYVYVINGYGGALLIGFMVVKNIRLRMAKSKSTVDEAA